MAYLEIYSPPTDKTWPEMLALHCDPVENRPSKHLKYKLTPHLHLAASLDPFPESHIALYLDLENEIYKDTTSFNKYLKSYAEMLKIQFVDGLTDDISGKIARLRQIV